MFKSLQPPPAIVIAKRGCGAIELFEQITPRSVRGEENPEHVLAGNSMAEVLHQGDYKKPRKESQSKDTML
jgi:hypothetical protein